MEQIGVLVLYDKHEIQADDVFNSATNDVAGYQIMWELMGAAGGRAARFITPPPPSDADSLSGNGGECAKSHTDVALCSSFQNETNKQAMVEHVHGSRQTVLILGVSQLCH